VYEANGGQGLPIVRSLKIPGLQPLASIARLMISSLLKLVTLSIDGFLLVSLTLLCRADFLLFRPLLHPEQPPHDISGGAQELKPSGYSAEH
jgi:hypothetical protein